MGSKLIFLGILLAMVLISSDAARQLAKETTINDVAPSPVNDAKDPVPGYDKRAVYPVRCYRCCSWSNYYGQYICQCCSSAAQP